jgi:protein-S-isoprenylcysteine O-methyltransferase Ste14
MYSIASLTIPVPPQVVEGLVVLTTLWGFKYVISRTRAIAPIAEAESGAIRTRPTTFIGKAVTPIQALASFIPSVIYVLCVTGNLFTQPAWMQRMNLPNDYFQYETEVLLRIAACALSFVLFRFVGRTFMHLGNQWHVIGRREKPRVVQTGPYAVVRHPLYMNVLMHQALLGVMFWSYAPLFSLGIVAGAFAVKMPIEEALIMQDSAVAAEYRAYMKRVPARVIPFLW